MPNKSKIPDALLHEFHFGESLATDEASGHKSQCVEIHDCGENWPRQIMKWFSKLKGLLKSGDAAAQPAGGCQGDHGVTTLEYGTPEFELFVAKGELESNGDLKHGAKHLANLLSFDPGRKEWLELLERYLQAAGADPESLYPISDQRYFAEEAVRAYIWARQGRITEAVDLIFQVAQAKPDVDYVDAWLWAWLEAPQVLEQLAVPTALRLLAHGLNRFPEYRLLSPAQERKLQRYADFAQRLGPSIATDANGTMCQAGILRKAGRFSAALAIAQQAVQTRPGWHASVALGLIHREQGQLDEAIQSFRKALEFDADDISARLEAADTCGLKHDWPSALAWYQQVLERESDHPWARPSALFCQWRISNNDTSFKELVQLASGNPPNDRAQQLCVCRQAYTGVLPEPVDATANILRQLAESMRQNPENVPQGHLEITLNCPEAPSNYLALQLMFPAAKLALNVESIPQPDPRQPCQEVKHPLWKYSGINAAPALPPPPPVVLDAVAGLASATYDYAANWVQAHRLAEQLGPGLETELLAAMVHPPPLPDGKSALEWLPRVQLAAAQIIAQCSQFGDTNWRDCLYSALFGPRDWTTQAAIIALVQLASEIPTLVPEIRSSFDLLAQAIPNAGHWGFAHALYANWRLLPGLEESELNHLANLLRQIES